jgi:hypothetical protein
MRLTTVACCGKNIDQLLFAQTQQGMYRRRLADAVIRQFGAATTVPGGARRDGS